MRRKKALYAIITTLILQIINITFNFIVPKYIIINYGSEVNGILNSITQFLSYVALLEAGIGGVIKSYLYKILAKKDNEELSSIMGTTERYFQKISYTLIGYVIVLCIIYPFINSNGFSMFYTASLILIIAISSMFQYYFGITNQLLIQADQKLYIINIVKTITILISSILMIVTIKFNASIQLVKLIGTIVYIFGPLYYHYYVKKNYIINKEAKKKNLNLSQKRDGFAHTLAAFLHSNTDVAILTFMSSMLEVSVYSVYSLVTNGLKTIIGTLTSSISATFGNMLANNEIENLKRKFESFDYLNILIVTIIFLSANFLVNSFISLYTKGVNDVNYIRPTFASFLLLAEAIYCIRCSYSSIIFAAGHFKETKKDAFLETIINILLSLILVKSYGILGVAIGTFIAMLSRHILSIKYLIKNIIYLDLKKILKKYVVNIFAIIITIFVVNSFLTFYINNYLSWIGSAFITTVITIIIILGMNIVLCKNEMYNIYKVFIKPFIIRKRKREV